MFDARRSVIAWRRSHIRHHSSLRLRGVKSEEGLQVFRVRGDDAAVGRQVPLLQRVEFVSSECRWCAALLPCRGVRSSRHCLPCLPVQHAAPFITILSGMLCMHVMVG